MGKPALATTQLLERGRFFQTQLPSGKSCSCLSGVPTRDVRKNSDLPILRFIFQPVPTLNKRMSLSAPLVARLCLPPPFLHTSSSSVPTQGLLVSFTASAAPPLSQGKSSRVTWPVRQFTTCSCLLTRWPRFSRSRVRRRLRNAPWTRVKAAQVCLAVRIFRGSIG